MDFNSFKLDSLPETMEQFGCSVFESPIWGIISRVFDVRRDFSARYFFGSSMFDIRLDNLGNYFSFCSMFDQRNFAGFIELQQF